MFSRLFKTVCLFSYALVLLLPAAIRPAEAHGDEPTISDYYTPCQNGSEGRVSTFHGVHRDGQPPMDHSRRTYDFRCYQDKLYAPHAGRVYATTPKYGGLILIDDDQNKACMIFLGIKSFAVEKDQQVNAGTFLGIHGRFHLAAIDGKCNQAGLYDVEARTRERPVAWIEIGKVLPHDIRRPDTFTFVSQNPGGMVM
jgi:hypothetical protein